MTVEPVEHERGRYWVQSRTNGGTPYLVDMEEFGGNGWCGCLGFLHYIDRLEQGAAPSPKLQCRHIKAVIRTMAFAYQNSTTPETKDENSPHQTATESPIKAQCLLVETNK